MEASQWEASCKNRVKSWFFRDAVSECDLWELELLTVLESIQMLRRMWKAWCSPGRRCCCATLSRSLLCRGGKGLIHVSEAVSHRVVCAVELTCSIILGT